jgi:hypothetical protein
VTFPDHFSDHADRYRAYRPTYPDALITYLASLASDHDLAWDCATGNGQAALGLTPNSTPSSPPTPARSRSPGLTPPKIRYLVAPVERTPLKDDSVDLVTVRPSREASPSGG